MVSPVLLVIWIGLILYQIYKWMTYKPPNFPPGPPRLPIFGTYPIMLLINYKHLHKAVDWLCKYYKTDVLGLYTASYATIIGSSNATVKELLNNPKLDGKPDLKLAQIRDPDFVTRGIFFSEGQTWFEQRRFSLRFMRDFGFGRRQDELESEIQDEILILIDLLKNGPKYEFEKNYCDSNGAVIPNVFFVVFGNLLLKVVQNERLPREKHFILHEAGARVLYFGQNADAWGRIFSLCEWTAKLFPNLSGFNLLREAAMKFYDSIKAIVDEQYKTFDPKHERHFLDMCFKQIAEGAKQETSTHSYEQLVVAMTDFFMPGLVANAIQLQFLLQRMYLQPEIWKKCQDEIENVVGQSRLPTLDDRQNLAYVEATIRECLRIDTLVPNNLVHKANADTTIKGYDIPKGTMIFPMLNGSHWDEQAWIQPDQFKPERFLDESGKFSPKLDKSVPFSAGKRLCAGETFSRNTMFLVFSALVQNFDIKLPDNERMPLPNEHCTGIFQYAPEFRLKFVPR